MAGGALSTFIVAGILSSAGIGSAAIAAKIVDAVIAGQTAAAVIGALLGGGLGTAAIGSIVWAIKFFGRKKAVA
ncbi:hypothetical protein ADK55_28765 [Streptomyces sp. WM4235]|nr:hypothetical protein ADK55_28765 [Streptomyces sp. WM4235]